MDRWLSMSLVLAAVYAASGCNNPACGPGTKQVQQSNGELKCVPTDGSPMSIICDADAGAMIIGGKCVSIITCGPNTQFNAATNQCEGTGGNTMPHVPMACPTPKAGTVCINGVVHHLVDNSFLDGTEMVRVSVYNNPLAFLGDPTTAPAASADTNDTFLFKDVPVILPQLALGAGDTAAVTTKVLQLTGAGAVVSVGKSYRVDVFITPKAVVDMWSAQDGVNYDQMGALVLRYFKDAAPPSDMLISNETMPLAGVQATKNMVVDPTAKYFGADMMHIDTAATMTSAVGAALLTGTGDASIPSYSGMGGGIMWEVHPGNSTGHIVFVESFHPCMMDMSGNCVAM